MKFALVVDREPIVFAPILHATLSRLGQRVDSVITAPGVTNPRTRAAYRRAVMRIIGVKYAARSFVGYVRSPHHTFASVSRRHGVPFFHAPSVNAPSFHDWLRARGITTVLSASAEIYRRDTLSLAGVDLYNLHGSLLPGNKGLLPIFWAVMNDAPQGVTLHRIVEQLDAGDVVFQERLEGALDPSLPAVTDVLFSRFPQLMERAIDHLERGLPPALDDVRTEASYGPIPDKAQVQRYFAKLAQVT